MSGYNVPFIAADENYLCPDIGTTAVQPQDAALHLIPSATVTKLKTLGPSRIRDMRANGISLQILSHIPIDAPPKTCQKINDVLYSTIVTSPDRFAALALLPVGDPREAANEMQRCITKYHFVGGLLGYRRDGPQLDGPDWEPLWTTAERYKLPIAFKPMFPTLLQLPEFSGTLAPPVLFTIIDALYPYHTVSPLLILRLYATKVFDRHPNLNLFLSPSGQGIPNLLPQIESIVALWPVSARPHRKFIEVWQRNIYVSTSDVLDLATMRALLEHIPADRVLFAGSHPLRDEARFVMSELRESGYVDKEQWEKIAWKNSEKLFGVKVGVLDKKEHPGRNWTSSAN